MLAHELKEAGPLVLPDGSLVLAVNYDLEARAFAAEGREKRGRLRITDGMELSAVLVAHVALGVAEIPSWARRIGALIRRLLNGDVVTDARHLALRDGGVSGAAD